MKRVGWLVLSAVLWFAKTIHAQEKPPQTPAAAISAPPDPAFPGAADSMAGDRTTLVNMDRNHDLRLTDRRPRRAKDFEPELSRGSGFEFEIIGFTH
jgi:hypothetical protein